MVWSHGMRNAGYHGLQGQAMKGPSLDHSQKTWYQVCVKLTSGRYWCSGLQLRESMKGAPTDWRVKMALSRRGKKKSKGGGWEETMGPAVFSQ